MSKRSRCYTTNNNGKFEMSEYEFKKVTYKRKNSQFRSKKVVNNKNISSNESNFSIEISFKRILDAKLEISTTDLHASFLALLKEGLESLNRPKISSIVCLGIGKIGECLTARYQFAIILCLSDFYNVKISAYDPVFTEKDKELLSKFEVDVLTENLEGKFRLSGQETVLFYLPHCPKQLSNNLLWSNWGLNLTYCIIVANSFGNIIDSNSSKHLQLNANYITKIKPYTLELAIINNFKYYEIFNDLAIHAFPKLSYVCSDLWKDNLEPVYKESDTELRFKKMASKLTVLRQIISELRYALPKDKIKEDVTVKYILNQYRKYQTTGQQLCKAREEMEFMANTYLCYLRSGRLSKEIQKEFHGKGERTVEDTAKMVGFKLPHDPK